MRFGLLDSDITFITKIIVQFSEIEEVIVFGSRAMGNYKPGSDIDLCLKGKNITIDTLSKLKAKLEDQGPLPYMFDLVAYELIDNSDLKKHIDQFGILLT